MKTFRSFLFEQQVENSSGEPIHPTKDGVVQFWNWFNGSKVVDGHGRPIVVYRGDFPNKTSFTGHEDKSNILKGSIFFTDKPDIGKKYVRNPKNYANDWRLTADDLDHTHGLYRVYLALKNPLVIDAKGEDWSEIPVPEKVADAGGFFRGVGQIDDVAQTAKKMGYDGLIVLNCWDQHGDGTQYVAFDPKQIKSATTNSGAFGDTESYHE